MIEYELQQIITNIAEVRWIRIVQFDGLSYRKHRFDSEAIKRDTAIDLEEDAFSAMSVAALTLAERVSAMVGLGNSFRSVIEAEDATHFFLPIGDGTAWFISFVVRGQADVNATLKYFKDRDNLSISFQNWANPPLGEMIVIEQVIEQELRQIITHIPELNWLRFIHISGIVHRTYGFDADNINHYTDLDLTKDRFGASSCYILGILERIATELVLGHIRFTVISGESGSHFLLPLGDGTEWLISFVVIGKSDINATLKYFKDHDYLAHIIPHLSTK